MIGAALLVVGGVIGALIGHNVGTGGESQRAGNGRTFRNGYGPGGGFGSGGQGQPGQGQPGQGQQGQGRGNQNGPNQLPGAGAGFALGTVTAVDGDTVTIKQPNGKTVTVKLSDSTAITVTKKGATSDVKVGEQVLATGQASSDGTVTARSLRVGDQLPFGVGRGAQNGSNAASAG
jgi:hypothetical protein